MKERKRKKKRYVPIIVIGVTIVILTGGFFAVRKNPNMRMFLSVMHFMNVTLKDPDYLLYEIDIMELCREYFNADTQIEGTAGISHMQKVKSSIFMNVDATRSFAQKRLASHMNLDFVVIDAGKLNMYAENDTLYLDAPILGDNIGYAFPTGDTLFRKAPDLQSDINQKWFRENMLNIVSLITNIGMEKTGQTMKDDDGSVSEGFVVTIPKGQGDFIWELLGMEPPEYDVVTIIYLTKDNHIRRMEMDLSHVLKGASVMIDGESMGTCYFYRELPEDEKVELSIMRNAKYDNWMDCKLTYTTNKSEILTATSNITWKNIENGFEFKVNDLVISRGEKLLGEGFFKGSVVKLDKEPDVFEGKDQYLYSLPVLDWREVRDNSETFVNDVLSRTAMSVLNE